MRRIDSPNRSVDLFGIGKDGFQAAVPGVSSATELTAKWFNAVQEAIVRTIEAAGIGLSEVDLDQFTAAIQFLATAAASGKVTQGGGVGQIAGTVKIGAAAGGKLKADVGGADLGNVAFEAWVTGQCAAQISAQVAALVNSAPTTLDQLNELAAAMANDPAFSVTMTTALAGKESRFASGTCLLFQQSAAPVGWTKVVSSNNAALRVVSGAAGSGGSVDFTSAFVNGSVGATGLTIAQMPSHAHSITVPTYTETGIGVMASGATTTFDGNITFGTDAVGGGTTHTHTLNLDVKYVDVIIASKN